MAFEDEDIFARMRRQAEEAKDVAAETIRKLEAGDEVRFRLPQGLPIACWGEAIEDAVNIINKRLDRLELMILANR